MLSRYAGSIAALILVSLTQFWFMGVLLVSRQMESLLIGGIMGFVFWAWCFWAFYLQKRRTGLVFTGVCMLITLLSVVLGLVDMLEETGLQLTSAF